MARQRNLSNESCLFCSDRADPIETGFVDDRGDPIILDDEDVKAKVLKALCNHLMPQNLADIPVQFSEDMFPFCTSCKDLVMELWECQEVIRKTQLRMAEITTTIEKKVVDDVFEAFVLDDKMPSSAALSEKRFIKLRDVIFEHYKETLITKRKEKLTSIHLATSSPVSVISEVKTAEASCSVIISSPSSTKCDKDVNDATRKEYAEVQHIPAAEPSLPVVGISISANESNQKISQSLFDNDPLFEEEYHVLKSELHSESEMEDLDEDKASESGGEAKDQPCVNQVVATVSPPGPSKPLRRTRKRISNIGRSTQSWMVAQGKKPRQYVVGKPGTFEGTEYKILKNNKVKCGCCSHVYSNISNFKRHVSDKESHQCSVCKKTFTQAYTLRAHHYEIHGAGKKKKFPCPNCDRHYSRRRVVNDHFRNRCLGRIKGGMQ